jgi:hypothetical protein
MELVASTTFRGVLSIGHLKQGPTRCMAPYGINGRSWARNEAAWVIPPAMSIVAGEDALVTSKEEILSGHPRMAHSYASVEVEE